MEDFSLLIIVESKSEKF